VSAVLSAVALAEADHEGADLLAAVEQDFLALLRWNPESRVLIFPQDHPVLGWPECRVAGCGKTGESSTGLCAACSLRWRRSGASDLEEFLLVAKPDERCVGVGLCAVRGCQRPWKTARKRLCHAHEYQQRVMLDVPLEVFLADPDVVPHASFGPCAVVACTRDRTGHGPYCHSHRMRWAKDLRRTPGLDPAQWCRTVSAVAENSAVSLRGLHPRATAEVIYGLQERTRRGAKTQHWQFRPFCDLLRRLEVSAVEDLPVDQLSPINRRLRNSIVTSLRRRRLTPETERHKDVWDLGAFGHGGTLRFGEISQSWLREAVKRWACDDLPTRRGDGVSGKTQCKINSMAVLSESLRLQRDDRGEFPSRLGRADIAAFRNRLAYLAAQGTISQHKRLTCAREARLMLTRMRTSGLTRPGEPLHGLPDDFALGRQDMPDEPEDTEAGKDLPVEVVRHLCEHLPWLERGGAPEVRVAVELLIDTGRRPDEICQLKLDCMERDGDGKPVLLYDNIKANRHGRRLPIAEATANLICKQQRRVRDRLPDEPIALLKLLPAPTRNPHGQRSITDGWVSMRHREWITSLPDILVPVTADVDGQTVTTMLPFDKARIFPYAYRHTYAQRHADAGVAVDVLRDLMDHRLLETSQRYYRVGETRRREAVERVTTMQFDRHGTRIWRQAKAMLDSEHARRAVGEVAVPYGSCSEPSNVAAGGQDCTLRFRCIGCGHFGTDISHLPDLERYLADLLRHRERLAATLDADEWAKSEAMPSDNEIKRMRGLIQRMKGDLDELTEEERAQIDEAVALVRRGRAKIVGLGIPRVRQPLPDVRPERSA
jgi:integrase